MTADPLLRAEPPERLPLFALSTLPFPSLGDGRREKADVGGEDGPLGGAPPRRGVWSAVRGKRGSKRRKEKTGRCEGRGRPAVEPDGPRENADFEWPPDPKTSLSVDLGRANGALEKTSVLLASFFPPFFVVTLQTISSWEKIMTAVS